MMIDKNALAYDDVLLVPQHSSIESRSTIDTGLRLGHFTLTSPIISAPMDTVTEERMALAMFNNGGLGVVHRYNEINEQVKIADAVGASAAFAIGVTGDFMVRAHALYAAGVRMLCIDVAHGHHTLVSQAIRKLRDNFPSIHIMAGNVATGPAAEYLWNAGADSIRVGIGGGSICSTRIETGHGVPVLQSLFDIKEYWQKKCHPSAPVFIADGGIRHAGDIVKALAAGADAVMLGSVLAGTDESPGHIIESEAGALCKVYRGMASEEAQIEWKGSFSSREGISARVPYKGPVKNVFDLLMAGIRSGMSYSGARNIKELQENAHFIVQSHSSIIESSTHINSILR